MILGIRWDPFSDLILIMIILINYSLQAFVNGGHKIKLKGQLAHRDHVMYN
jgi:hypothetical protein